MIKREKARCGKKNLGSCLVRALGVGWRELVWEDEQCEAPDVEHLKMSKCSDEKGGTAGRALK